MTNGYRRPMLAAVIGIGISWLIYESMIDRHQILDVIDPGHANFYSFAIFLSFLGATLILYQPVFGTKVRMPGIVVTAATFGCGLAADNTTGAALTLVIGYAVVSAGWVIHLVLIKLMRVRS